MLYVGSMPGRGVLMTPFTAYRPRGNRNVPGWPCVTSRGVQIDDHHRRGLRRGSAVTVHGVDREVVHLLLLAHRQRRAGRTDAVAVAAVSTPE